MKVIKRDDTIFVNSGGSFEFSDDSKNGQLRVKIDSDDGNRARLDAEEVVELRDWLQRLINVYEVEK